MSHILVRRIAASRYHNWGQDWWYKFTQIPIKCDEVSVTKYCQSLNNQYAKVTARWNEELNSEWISRIYFAVKMVLSSSVMALSLEHARKSNLRIVESYLEYYMSLNCLRAIMLTLPSQKWADGELMESTHTKTINVAIDVISFMNKSVASELEAGIRHLKALREYISYRGPSSGGHHKSTAFDSIEWCRFLLEIAQMQSELLERSVIKKSVTGHSLKAEYIKRMCHCTIDGVSFDDGEDRDRMGYLQRKHPLPVNILHMMSEGHVEDYFGAWCADEPDETMFNPDDDWQILFNVP